MCLNFGSKFQTRLFRDAHLCLNCTVGNNFGTNHTSTDSYELSIFDPSISIFNQSIPVFIKIPFWENQWNRLAQKILTNYSSAKMSLNLKHLNYDSKYTRQKLLVGYFNTYIFTRNFSEVSYWPFKFFVDTDPLTNNSNKHFYPNQPLPPLRPLFPTPIRNF